MKYRSILPTTPIFNVGIKDDSLNECDWPCAIAVVPKAYTVNEVFPWPSPGDVAFTVTVPGVNIDRIATLHMPPSARSSGSSGEW